VTRRAAAIVAALAVLAVVLAVVGQRGGAPATGTGSLLVPGLAEALNDIERVVVTRAGGETVATLVRGATGWTVAEKAGYAADVAKIRQALVSLSEARIVEAKTADPAFHDRLGVEAIEAPTATGVAIALEGPATFPVLVLGDSPKSTSRYVRRATEQASFLIDRNPEIPSTTADWLVTEILDVPGASVKSVTIKHSDGEEIALSKTDPAETGFTVAAIPAGRELSYAGVANVIGNALRELKLDDVTPAPTESAAPTSVTEFRTFDGLVVTVTSTLDGEAAWLTFAADAEPTTVAPADEGASAPSVEPGGEPAAEAASPDPAAQAAAINARVTGWRYRIPEYQHGQLTRRWADLLKAPE
jgi:hypothetical protein